ncbi:hypothetical protein SYK_31310 [Pseudodesulfovibrio nedwellii]|uniref:Helix-turn-helix domain-containing protein n=1 Tax=Pseudodesulfovibrio nedwellii TaxID=2973072 RepID=A0ABN6S655_9BACT|nr:helix-turn-helix domain-containing protein [Pseudodesulfovibrio nedwellii]BDQ38771.1 hypothetical protein SYK_31310 [Pseudodesulfovibrio nedwellii]
MSNKPLNTKRSCWLKMGQAMSMLNVSRDTMRSYCEQGLVCAKKLPSGHWRIEQGSVDQFMQTSSRLVVERLRGLML